MTVLEICEWLEGTALGALARESLYGFQILVGMHLLGLTVSVGILVWVDLRLLGIGFQSTRISEVYRSLSPWFLTGFAVMLVSGFALFAGFATSAYGNVYFRIKLVALLLAGANALAFHALTQRASPGWGATRRPSPATRLAGLASIVLWTAVILAGRMISYTMF